MYNIVRMYWLQFIPALCTHVQTVDMYIIVLICTYRKYSILVKKYNMFESAQTKDNFLFVNQTGV